MTIRDWIATRAIQHRGIFLILVALVTLAFAMGLPRVKIATVFSDLLPADHGYVRVFKDHPN